VTRAVDVSLVSRGREEAAAVVFRAQLSLWQARVNAALAECLPAPQSSPTRLHEAMRYSVLGGGKRVRPMLMFATAQAIGLGESDVERAACAVELLHAYSLVHDDLPAMDDDDLRRGRPTCHVAYDDATAVLVGDALQSLAFELLVSGENLPASAQSRVELVRLLASAAGSHGMAGGQALDLAAEGMQLSLAEVDAMHALKTGALIRASVLMAAACAPALDARQRQALAEFAECIGLAFQIKDDLLDVTGDSAQLGKATGADQRHAKATYPSILGVPAAQVRLRGLHERAEDALVSFGERADSLRSLAHWLLARAN